MFNYISKRIMMKKNLIVMMLMMITSYNYAQEKQSLKPLDISSGYFEGNNKVSKKEFKQILSTNPKAFSEFKRGKTIQTTGTIIAAGSAIYLGLGIGGDNFESEDYIVGGVGLLGGFLAVIGGKSLVNKSVKTYNSSIKELTFNLKSSTDGIGIAISF